jgi:ATP-dependent Clp protease protease subunit
LPSSPFVLEADEAKAFGIIDEVFDKRPEPGDDAGTGAGDVTPA